MRPPAFFLLAPLLFGCGDEDPSIHPGASEVVADGVDQNCDGGDACYRDRDRDGYGSQETLASVDLSCLDYGESSESTDCDDDDASAYPGAPEVVGNEQDNDCDGGEVCFEDLDGDGYGTLATVVSTDSSCRDPVESRYSTDCDDDEPEVNPSVEEVCNDHVDNDCDGTEGPCDFWGEVSVAEADAKFVGED
ncbi:MAG: putative metal-binding motif-containing protein, partial [Deltaproteobacteria bacterium]|nr:putative metal-binding motif-containing protein [Deltaproteobacteria bacterium]